jgi:hypothetical protein
MKYLVTLALLAALTGCKGTIGTILYLPSTAYGSLTVGPTAALPAPAAPASGVK